MLWTFKDPESGDMIRVKSGLLYHYGVFISKDEIVQFGLAPVNRPQLSDRDVAVCVSDLSTFLSGGVLEVAEFDKKEHEARRSREETVALARSRIGEKGYNILYNNCEHFAYECLLGKHYCSQTERVRALFQSFPILDVYVAEIPQNTPLPSVYPKTRNEEIESCGSEKVKREKYYAWKLLEYALERTFGKKLKKLDFSKTENGKWVCKDCEFSLSHSKNAAAVALSRKRVGVDIELCASVKAGVAEKILTPAERTEYDALTEGKEEYLLTKWTQKESVFKSLDQPAFLPARIETSTEKLRTKKVTVAGEEYLLSVASENTDKFRLHENIILD